MNIRSYAAITLALAALSPVHGGEVAVAGPAKLRPTHDQLSKRKATAPEITRGVSNYVPADAADVKRNKPEAPSLIKRSTIISFGGFWTIVPKDAVLHTPANYRSRISNAPNGRLLTWSEFYSRNRGWIYTQNVKISDARGDSELTRETVDAYRRTGRLVVAVCHQGPISVRRPEPAGKADSPSNS